MSKPNPQDVPGGSFNPITNKEISLINNSISNDSIPSLEAAKTLIQFAERVYKEGGHLDNALLEKINPSDYTIKEFNNLIGIGYYNDSNSGEKIPISPKINIISNININKQVKSTNNMESISWADDIDMNNSFCDNNKADKSVDEYFTKITPISNNKTVTKTPLSVNKSISNFSPIKYDNFDLGPFVVMIESESGVLSYQKVGKVLCNNPEFGVTKVAKRGRNRVALFFDTSKKANKFLDASEFLEYNKYKAFIPFHLISCKGLLRDVDINFSEEEILNNLRPIGTNREIFHVRRIKKKVTNSESGNSSYVNTPLIVFTIRGSFRPEKVSLYMCSLQTEAYIAPITQCFNCLKFGHTAPQCRGKKKCSKCGDDNPDDNPALHDSCLTFCIYCKSTSHNSVQSGIPFKAKDCPEFINQKKIKELMSLNNLSFFEANSIIKSNDNVAESFSSMIKSTPIKKFINPNSNSISFPNLSKTNIFEPNTSKKHYKKTIFTFKNNTPTTKRPNFYDNNSLINPNGRVPDSPPFKKSLLENVSNHPTSSATQIEEDSFIILFNKILDQNPNLINKLISKVYHSENLSHSSNTPDRNHFPPRQKDIHFDFPSTRHRLINYSDKFSSNESLY